MKFEGNNKNNATFCIILYNLLFHPVISLQKLQQI
jgi:hypothetical protein